MARLTLASSSAALRGGSGPDCSSSDSVGPLNVLHAEVHAAAFLADLVHGHDPDVVQPGGRLGFGQEPLAVAARRERAAENHLHRQLAIQIHLPRQVHDPHPAATDLLQQFVVSQSSRRGERSRTTSPAPRSSPSVWRAREPDRVRHQHGAPQFAQVLRQLRMRAALRCQVDALTTPHAIR